MKNKINAFFDGDNSDIRSIFGGNPFLTDTLVAHANQAKAAKDSYRARGGSMLYFLKIKDELKSGFLDQVGKGNQELCSCRNLFRESAYSGFFPHAIYSAQNECRKKC